MSEWRNGATRRLRGASQKTNVQPVDVPHDSVIRHSGFVILVFAILVSSFGFQRPCLLKNHHVLLRQIIHRFHVLESHG